MGEKDPNEGQNTVEEKSSHFMRKVISTKVIQVVGTGYEINVFYQNQKGIRRLFAKENKCYGGRQDRRKKSQELEKYAENEKRDQLGASFGQKQNKVIPGDYTGIQNFRIKRQRLAYKKSGKERQKW